MLSVKLILMIEKKKCDNSSADIVVFVFFNDCKSLEKKNQQ